MLDFWDAMCYWVSGSRCLKGMLCLQLQSQGIKEECSCTLNYFTLEDWGILFQNVRSNPPSDTVPRPRKHESSTTWPWIPQISEPNTLRHLHNLLNLTWQDIYMPVFCVCTLCVIYDLLDWEVMSFDSRQGKKFFLLLIIPTTFGVSCSIAPR